MTTEYDLDIIYGSTPLLSDDALTQENAPKASKCSKKTCPTCGHDSTPEAPPRSSETTKWGLSHGFFHCGNQDVHDGSGNPAYHVSCKGFWLLDLKFKDLNNNRSVVVLAKQRFTFNPTFDLYYPGSDVKFATFKMRCSWAFQVDVKFDNGEPDLHIHGKHLAFNYQVSRGEVIVAKVERTWGRHNYEISAGEDQRLIHVLIALTDKSLTITKRKVCGNK